MWMQRSVQGWGEEKTVSGRKCKIRAKGRTLATITACRFCMYSFVMFGSRASLKMPMLKPSLFFRLLNYEQRMLA